MNNPMRCVIGKCRTEQNRRDPNISFHRFPEYKFKRNQWISALKLEAKDINQRSIVCSLHFRDEDFLTDYLAGRRRLRPTAVPFLPKDPLSVDQHSPSYYKLLSNDIIEEDSPDEHSLNDYIEEDHQDDELQDLYDNVKEDIEQTSVVVGGNQIKQEALPPDSCGTISEENTSNDTGTIASPSLERTQQLEAKVEVLEKAVVQRDRMIKVLNTKIRFKSEKIENLLQIISKLKRGKRKAHQTKLKRPSIY